MVTLYSHADQRLQAPVLLLRVTLKRRPSVPSLVQYSVAYREVLMVVFSGPADL
jgi:hypothetical protein